MARVVATVITIALLAVPLIGSPAAAGTPKCQGFKATKVGTNGADVIRGTAKRDVIVARGGADKIYGKGGKDIICAGAGKDKVIGGAGNDKIYGGDKNDVLKGGSGWDVLNGGKGSDACYTQADGGKKVACEEADLKVTINAPDTVVGKSGDSDKFDVTVTVKNIGAKTAKDVVVDLKKPAMGLVTCVHAIPASVDYTKLVPTEYVWMVYDVDCGVPDASSGSFVLQAEATTTSFEPIVTNNADESSTTIEKAP